MVSSYLFNLSWQILVVVLGSIHDLKWIELKDRYSFKYSVMETDKYIQDIFHVGYQKQ